MSNEKAVAKASDNSYLALHGDAKGKLDIVRENVGTGALKVFDLDQITVPAGGATSFEVPTLAGTENVKEIHAVCVRWLDVRQYWEKDFAGGEPPDCASNDMVRGIGKPGGLCETCPNSQWESAPKGGGKACKEKKILFLLTKDSLLPKILSVPPTSLSVVNKLFLQLAGKIVKYNSVELILKLDQAKSNDGIKYSKLNIVVSRQLSEDEAAHAEGFTRMITEWATKNGSSSGQPANGKVRHDDIPV